jgi:hypothetical protein
MLNKKLTCLQKNFKSTYLSFFTQKIVKTHFWEKLKIEASLTSTSTNRLLPYSNTLHIMPTKLALTILVGLLAIPTVQLTGNCMKVSPIKNIQSNCNRR